MNKIYAILLTLLSITACREYPEKQALIEENERPNIIFIMADDHAIQAISAYGHPISKLAPTPNIDRIAKEGALFKNNFCTNSICGPSRAVILTGKHSHINGFRMNGERFDGSQPTFPKMLQNAGYNTAIVGKWHLHGFPEGFDHWKILNDQGNYYNPQFITEADSAAIDKKRIDSTAHWNARMHDTTIIEGYATDLITDYALDFIKKSQSTDNKKPFMLMVHHKAPHRNWMPAIRHANKYDSIEFPIPDTYFTDHKGSLGSKEQQQTIYVDMYEGHDLKMTESYGSTKLAHNPWTTDFDRMTAEQRRQWDSAYLPKNNDMHKANYGPKEMALYKGQRYLQDYLATIASVDEGVGRILDYLEESGLAENTLIVYTTDQGFYLGEKGWFDKRYMYEQSLSMPVLMRHPGSIKPGTVITALTQNLDFPETFLDYAGVNIPADMQGQSLRPLLEGNLDDGDFRNAIYYHYYDFPAFHMVKKQYGVRTDRYKLIHFYDDIDQWELYDLEKDPKELSNLIDEADYDEIEDALRKTLDSLQSVYKVTEKEFERAPKESVERAYEQFKRLRGNSGSKYYPNKEGTE